MPRPKQDRTKVHANVENDIIAELELYLLDPVKGKMVYGGFSTIVNLLLRKFLENLRRAEDPKAYLAACGVDITALGDDDATEDNSEKENRSV